MLIVQKYGGTSVGGLDRIANVAKRVAKAREEGNDLVVVVSAMSGETNKLIEYAHHFSKTPSKRADDQGGLYLYPFHPVCQGKSLIFF